MKYLVTLLFILGFGLSGFGQTIKTLGYNTTNGQIIYSGTNTLSMPANIIVDSLKANTEIVFQSAFSFDDVESLDIQETSRANLGLGATWLTNTNVTIFRTAIGLGATNNPEFDSITLGTGLTISGGPEDDVFVRNESGSLELESSTVIISFSPISFNNTTNAATTRANLGFSTNLNTLWTATNASNTRSAVGLGWSALTNTNASTSLLGFNTNGQVIANTGTNILEFPNIIKIGVDLIVADGYISGGGFNGEIDFEENQLFTGDGNWNFADSGIENAGAIAFNNSTNAATTRANLGFSTNLNTLWTATNASNARSAIGIGDTNTVAFSGIYNNGNFTNNNGTIYGLKTNVGPFEGIGNFFASNNTTVSNETLFRVGLAEATNKSAQFGFRVARTNNGGEGFAVFSVFGYNALMMIGPSDRSRSNYATNTNAGVEATLWTITPTNQVMTLRDTNTGATTLHQSLGFDTNVTSTAPANTTNIVKWIEVWVGTNSYRMPLYQ